MSAAWTTVQQFFSSPQGWLITIKYLGLVLAAGSSIWGTISEVVTPRPDGGKRLSKAGIISIGLTIAGLAISILSEDIQRREALQTQAAQVKVEAARTNQIILEGQQLRSLRLAWTFAGLDTGLIQLLDKGKSDAMQFIDHQQGNRNSQQNGAVFREMQLYPFIVALARRFVGDSAKGNSANVVVLLALDDDPNSVLVFGHLDNKTPWEPSNIDKKAKPPALPSLEIGSNGYLGNMDLESWPELAVEKEKITITWRVDPLTLTKALNGRNELVLPTAKLPDTLRIAILFDIAELPFAPNNFARPTSQDF